MNPFASEFVPGGGFSSFSAPAPQPQPAPKESWDEGAEDKAAPKEEEKPIVKEAPKAQPAAAPTTSTFKLDDDDIEGDDEIEGDADTADVEKKLKKLNWGGADVIDPREHLNIVFIGHVDAGKSTCSGQILFLTGMVDDRTIQKFQKDATDKNRGSWFLAYIMDTIEEERAKGKTVEVGRAHFETEKKRYTILDAPGHKNFVPNMIMGVAQADVGLLVISARKGEFEAGFERTGQTREHAILARTLGVKVIVIAVNKMDEPSVEWSQARYDDIVGKMTKFLQGLGYNPKEDIFAVPIAGLTGANIKEKLADGVCPWYKGETLIGLLDALKPMPRQKDAPLRIPVLDKFKDMGQVNVMGKVEAGRVRLGQTVMFQPGGGKAEVVALANDMADLNVAECGENIRLVIKGVEEEHIHKGFVVCEPSAPIPVATEFVAQLTILELPEGKSLFTAGYAAVIHLHTAVEECTVVRLLAEIDPKTKEITKKLPKFSKSRSIVNVHIQLAQSICMESFKEFPQLGRFTLRDEGKTIALGKVLYVGPPRKKAAK